MSEVTAMPRIRISANRLLMGERSENVPAGNSFERE